MKALRPNALHSQPMYHNTYCTAFLCFTGSDAEHLGLQCKTLLISADTYSAKMPPRAFSARPPHLDASLHGATYLWEGGHMAQIWSGGHSTTKGLTSYSFILVKSIWPQMRLVRWYIQVNAYFRQHWSNHSGGGFFKRFVAVVCNQISCKIWATVRKILAKFGKGCEVTIDS